MSFRFGIGIKLSAFHKVQMSTNYKKIILYYLLCPLLCRGTGTCLSSVREITHNKIKSGICKCL